MSVRASTPVGPRHPVLTALGAAALLLALGAADPASRAWGADRKMAPALPTARTALAAVEARARKWQADAVLVVLETSNAAPDGRANNWLYVYHSPKTGQKSSFLADEKGGIEQQPAVSWTTAPVGDFVDSDKAMSAAVRAGMKTHDFGMKMSLSKSERTEWALFSGDLSFTVDAATGAFLRKEE